MPTYNGARRGFLLQAMESVLTQKYHNLELLVIDDGSTDGTAELCKSLRNPRIRYIYQENSGVSVARNNGIKQALGEYVCFLDDDDIWLPDKLSTQINFVTNLGDPNLGLCYTALEIITKDGVRTGTVQSHHAYGNVFEELLCENLVDCTSSVLVPRGIFDKIGFFKPHLSYAEDYDLWLRIAKKYNIYSINKPLVLYRVHGDKLSAGLEKIEFYAMLARFEAMQNESVDSNRVYNHAYKTYAAHRFWLGDYKIFRRYVRFAKAYGSVGLGMRIRVWLSYVPWVVRLVRSVRSKLFN